MPTVFITGASRGIGLEFCRQYLADGWQVIATCRTPAAATDLAALDGDIEIHQLDTTDYGRVAELADSLSGTAIDHLILNAGINLQTRVEFGDVDYDLWLDELQTNTVAPLAAATAFADHVAASDKKLIVSMSSGAGSKTRIRNGGHYVYRATKAGLNAVMRALSFDLAPRGIAVIIIGPGHIRTDMGGADAPLALDETIATLRKSLLTIRIKDTGRFINSSGEDIPW